MDRTEPDTGPAGTSPEPTGSATSQVEFRSFDGLRLRGTLVAPPAGETAATVLVHGGGVTREEGGFFARLAAGLAGAGSPTLRFDFRGHGESEGRQEDLTIAGVVNDIRAAVAYVRAATRSGPVNLVGASFGGGISAFFAYRYPGQVRRLVLINPLLDYRKRFIDDKPEWRDDQISEDAGQALTEQGFLSYSPTPLHSGLGARCQRTSTRSPIAADDGSSRPQRCRANVGSQAGYGPPEAAAWAS